jgi:small subunit ribosomal protein S11
MARRARTRRRERKFVPQGKVFVHATFNNTIVTLTDTTGAVVAWGSGGTVGFKGSRKGTAYAAQRASENAARRAMEHGMKTVEVFVRGPGAGREAAVRALQGAGLRVSSIKDMTPSPHNGCRPPKEKRS